MKTVYKNRSVTKNKTHSKESGFVILMGLLVLVLGAAAWFGTAGNLRSEGVKLSSQSIHVVNLERIKEKMLAYAVLHPELFLNLATNLNAPVPGPGYFPCPDMDGDGNSDGGACVANNFLFAIGMVPIRLANRNFSFLASDQDHGKYWFAVDARYIVRPVGQRVGSLNFLTSPQVDTNPLGVGFCGDENVIPVIPAPATCVAPITVDGQGDVVMVLFYAGDPINGQVRTAIPTVAPFPPLNVNQYLEQTQAMSTLGALAIFESVGNPNTFNDYVITITREEWDAAMLSRVAIDANPTDGVPDLCNVPNNSGAVDAQSWFNECRSVGVLLSNPCTQLNLPAGEVANLEGQGWRFALGC